jgi:hypothetical protein
MTNINSDPIIPSTDLTDPYFNHLTYWRGPIWATPIR